MGGARATRAPGIRADELATAFGAALVQLAGNVDAFIEARRTDSLDGYLDAVEENDFEWFEDLYFGEFDRGSERWSGLVEGMYAGAVGYVLDNVAGFVVRVERDD